MDIHDKRLEEYARLLVEVGVNVQPGQELLINCPVDCAWFARMCVKAAYDAGCRQVTMGWSDEIIGHESALRAADETFDEYPQWRADLLVGLARKGAGFLHIDASDPELMADVDPQRFIRMRKAGAPKIAEYRQATMTNACPWAIGAVPVPSWARKVFPSCSEEEAMDKLWNAILETVRVTGDGQAVQRWRQHLDTLRKRVDILNSLGLESLRYTNSLGTDLTIRLPEDHVWAGGDAPCKAGHRFIANMPTEEIFTAPLRDGIDGVVFASMPLVNDGVVIEKLRFVIRDGKIVEASAQTGEEKLKAAISVDEGASRFGEVALVPYDSPISNQKLLYYNTLFDENASCHLAFGEAYAECVKGGESMSKEELKAHGLNDSITHVDFMVGTADLSIVGRTHDGREIPIFVDGNFAI